MNFAENFVGSPASMQVVSAAIASNTACSWLPLQVKSLDGVVNMSPFSETNLKATSAGTSNSVWDPNASSNEA